MTQVIAEYLKITVAQPSEFPDKAIEAGGASYPFFVKIEYFRSLKMMMN